MKQKPVVAAGVKSIKGRPASGKGTLKEIKEEIAQNKDEPEPLSSDPSTIDDDDDDDKKNNFTKEDEDKENPPIVPKKHQTA